MQMQGLLIRVVLIKKVLVATVLMLVSAAAMFSSDNMEGLALLADDLVDGERALLAALAHRALDLGPEVLRVLAPQWDLRIVGVSGGLGHMAQPALKDGCWWS